MANDIQITVNAKDKASAKLRGVQGQAGKLGSMMGTALKAGAVAGGVALAGAGTAAVKMGLDFGKGMAEVKTLLPDLSEKGFGKLKGDILGLSKEMGIATSDMVPALYQAISAGVPPENVIDFLRTGAKASIGGVTDLATAVDGLTTVNNAFGYSADQTGRVADVMFTGVKLGKTTMDELSASMFQAAPLAAALGLDIEDVVAATATLTKGGVPTAQAMTSMQQAMVSLTKPNADMNKLLAETGYESGKALLEAEGLSGGLELLTKAAGGNETEMAKAFGSVEALKTVLGLTGPNAKIAAADLDAVTNSAGASSEAFETMSQTASYKLNKAINYVKVSLTELGDKALPLMVKGIEAVAKEAKVFLPILKEWWGEHGPAIMRHVKEFVQVVIDLAREIGGYLAPALDTLSDLWAALAPILERYILPVLEKVGKFLLDHKRELVLVAGAILLLTNPWLAVAAAIAVVLAKWDEISAFFKDLGRDIKAFVDSVIQKVSDFPVIGEIIKDTVRMAKVYIETQLRIIKALFQAALDTIINTFKFWKAVFIGDWGAAWNAVKAQFEVIVNLLAGLFGIALDAVKAIFDSKLEMVKGIGSDLGNLIVDAAEKVWEDLKRAFSDQVNAVAKWLEGAAGAVKAIGAFLGNLILGAAGVAWAGLATAFSTAVNAIATWITGAADAIKGIGASVGRLIMEGFSDGIRAAEGYVTGALNFLITLVERGINFLIDLINMIPDITIPPFGPFPGGTIGIPHIDPVSVPRLHRGGEVLRTGLAVVQEGERFTAAGAAGAGGRSVNLTINFQLLVPPDHRQAQRIVEFIRPELERALT